MEEDQKEPLVEDLKPITDELDDDDSVDDDSDDDDSDDDDSDDDDSVDDDSDDDDSDDDDSDDDDSDDDDSDDDDFEVEKDDDHYVFELSDDGSTVLAAFELDDGVLEPMSFNKNNQYEVNDDGQIVHTRSKPFGSEVTTFAAEGDYYVRFSEQWIGSSNPPTNNPVPALAQVLRYLPTDGDDDMAVRDGQLSNGGQGADKFVVREVGDLSIGDFKRDEGDKVWFDTGLGLTGKEELQSYLTELRQDGDNLIVEFGEAATITLIGVTVASISWDDVEVFS